MLSSQINMFLPGSLDSILDSIGFYWILFNHLAAQISQQDASIWTLEWEWGGPPQAENFANLRHPSDDFPLENSISEGKISRKCQNFPPAAG